jgi:NADPH:quinone reductase-like Zn-dependent oxidoreductase
MSFEQAAALPTALGTARQALFETGRLQQGQRVLVHAGAGGVGSSAIQLARRAGAHVVATTSAANLELARSLGAHARIQTGREFTCAVGQDGASAQGTGGRAPDEGRDRARAPHGVT